MDTEEIGNLQSRFTQSLTKIKTSQELEQIKIDYLGRKGLINSLLKNIKNVSLDKKKDFGEKINRLKQEIKRLIEIKRLELSQQKDKVFFDKTLPGKPYPKGSLHIVSLAIEEITRIFEKIGFIRVSYPEVDWDYYAFESLNMPKDHPARDDFETSYLDFPEDKKLGRMVLTPHTSNGQNREMRRVKKPPIRMINISKCYRPNWDATHTPMFYQFEGLCVDKNITIANLKGTLDYFAKEYFCFGTKTRLRPHHFQFTEPSFEVDVTCTVCKGKGTVRKCKVCKSGWLELGGTGMVHPNVLKEGGINPSEFTGWAFGFGIERVIMMKYGLDDIRNYYTGDIRFLEQF